MLGASPGARVPSLAMKCAAPILLVVAVAAFPGCNVRDPYSMGQRKAQSRRPPPSASTPDRCRPRCRPGIRPARAVVRTFAVAWIDWNWRTAEQAQRNRAALAVGRFREELLQDVRDARADRGLARQRLVSSGRLLAIALKAAGAKLSAYVVTRETVRSAGSPAIATPAVRVYRAVLERRADDWGILEWQPVL